MAAGGAGGPDEAGTETEISKAYPTEAQAREQERRKAQQESGHAHVVKKRDMKF